jgi:surface antigen
MARFARLQWRIAIMMAIAPAAGGCIGLSIPMGEPKAAVPTVTGSIGTASALPLPLPEGLAESDATAMAQAARLAFIADVPATETWQNPAIGSSGTLVAAGEAERLGNETCRDFVSTVTSLRGVHRYTCRACRTADGQVAIRSIMAAGAQTPGTAGI